MLSYLIPRLAIVLRLMWSPTHKLVNGQNNFTQFAATDPSVAVQIVQLEGPTQTLIYRTSQQGRQGDQ